MNILITGATSGIGRELALSYANSGHSVIAIGRNQVALDELTTNKITALNADVTSIDDLSRVQSSIKESFQHIDLLILNAGTCEYIDTEYEFSHKVFQNTIEINFMGMVKCIEYFLPLLRQSTSPHLVGVASMAYYLPLSRAEAYGASKAAVNYLLETLAIDLAHENIKVTVVNPGFVKTPLTNKNDFPMPFLVSTKDATKIIIDGIAQNKAEICFPKRLTIPMKILSFLPRTWWRHLGQKLRKKST